MNADDYRRQAAIKTLIANDSDVKRVLAERDQLAIDIVPLRHMFDLLKIHSNATDTKLVEAEIHSNATDTKLVEAEMELLILSSQVAKRDAQVNLLGFLFKAFFRRLFGFKN